MNDEIAQAMLAEMQALNRNLTALTGEMSRAATMVAAAQLIAVDAARSEVYATLMDDQLVDVARKLKILMQAAAAADA